MPNQKMYDSETINGETLKTHRKKRRWSQAELAEKCNCQPAQVSRWERDIGVTPRYRQQQALTKALGVEWDVLTRPYDGEKNREDAAEKKQLNVRVDQEVRNALSLVCLRYNVQAAEVISLAPLLFLIMAEKSLAWRGRNLDTLEEALSKISPLVPHLEGELGISIHRADGACSTEQESISARDVFGRRLEPEYTQPGNPLVAYLESLATDQIKDGLISYIDSDYPGETKYLIWDEERVRGATGLTGERESDDEILKYIWSGGISLDDVIAKRKRFSEDQYYAWLNELLAQIEEQSREFLKQF